MMSKHAVFTALLLLALTAGVAVFPVKASNSATAPHLDIEKAAGEITIDGDLEDPGWIGAATATGFLEHSPGQSPLSGTEPPDVEIQYQPHPSQRKLVRVLVGAVRPE